MEEKLKTGTTLIVDRYSYSGVAFSSAKGLDIGWCKVKIMSYFIDVAISKSLSKVNTDLLLQAPEIGLLAPDLVVYLDISPEVVLDSFFLFHLSKVRYTLM